MASSFINYVGKSPSSSVGWAEANSELCTGMGRGRPGRSVRAQSALELRLGCLSPTCPRPASVCTCSFCEPLPTSAQHLAPARTSPASGHCQNPLLPSPSKVKTRLQAFHPTFPSHWVIPWHLQGCVRQRASFEPERSHHRCCVLHWPVSS